MSRARRKTVLAIAALVALFGLASAAFAAIEGRLIGANGVSVASGDQHANELTVRMPGPGQLELEAPAAIPGPGCEALDTHRVLCPSTSLQARLGAGPDSVRWLGPAPRSRDFAALSALTGTGADSVRGSPRRDVVLSGGGADAIYPGRGRDDVVSGAGADRVFAGAGPDVAFGEGGPDVVHGGRGDDQIAGGISQDRLFGGAGDDTIDSQDDERDGVSCGPGLDRVQADRIDRLGSDCERVRSD